MDAKVCDRDMTRVIPPGVKGGKLSIEFQWDEGYVKVVDWDICPRCVPIVARYIHDNILLGKGREQEEAG